jgi:hypothetical protein
MRKMYSAYDLVNYSREKEREAMEESLRWRMYRKALQQQGRCKNLLGMLTGAINRLGAKLQAAAEQSKDVHPQSA